MTHLETLSYTRALNYESITSNHALHSKLVVTTIFFLSALGPAFLSII